MENQEIKNTFLFYKEEADWHKLTIKTILHFYNEFYGINFSTSYFCIGKYQE